VARHLLGCLLILVSFGLETTARAVTTALSSCAEAEVKNAITAASDGDIIICPAGSWSWSNVDIANRNITLQGAGIGRTTIWITAPEESRPRQAMRSRFA
jgi:hypothetical protein